VKAPFAVFLMGPTASGKSLLAMQLAEVLPVEIVSVDSAQVYQGMDIGTAKPSPRERAAVPHHLIDILPPTESYSAARFHEDASRLVQEISARNRIPLLVGGTMLYFKALREGLSDLPGADKATREAIDAEAVQRGWPALHAELATLDPLTASRLQPNDSQRIQRALEVFRLTGVPLSQVAVPRRKSGPALKLAALALVPRERSELHGRIETRFDAMLQAGLVEELRSLRSLHALSSGLPSMRTVGYRQAWEYLDGQIDRDALRARGIHATRQLAKRQLTWLRAMSHVVRLDCDDRSLGRSALEAIRRASG
jgi:tRNA dimethylallyltransferase